MQIFGFYIAGDQGRPSEGEGYVRAKTIQEAVTLVGHSEVNVYLPADAIWPGEPGEAVWQYRIAPQRQPPVHSITASFQE